MVGANSLEVDVDVETASCSVDRSRSQMAAAGKVMEYVEENHLIDAAEMETGSADHTRLVHAGSSAKE